MSENKISVKDEGPLKGYQSPEALKAATAKPKEAEEGEVSGEVGSEPVEKAAPGDVREDPMRIVRVKSRTYIPPFIYGKKRYKLEAGRETTIPLGVKRHLEEKGLL